jgi:hypothetical protein
MASILGGFFQYWASLNSIHNNVEKKLIFISYIVSAFFLSSYFIFGNIILFVLGLAVINISLSLKVGHSIGRGDYESANALNLTFSATKILTLILFLTFFIFQKFTQAFYIVLFSFILAEIIYIFLKSSAPEAVNDQPFKIINTNWVGPILFSILFCTLPQLDILWVSWFKNKETLTLISGLSFLSKGMFFFQVIAAQWVFSKQKKSSELIEKNAMKYGLAIFILLFLASTVGSFLMPILISKFLAWPQVPTSLQCFMASISAGMMSLFYQACQLKLIAKKNYKVVVSLFVVLVIFLISGYVDISLIKYFIILSLTYLTVIWGLLYEPKKTARD